MESLPLSLREKTRVIGNAVCLPEKVEEGKRKETILYLGRLAPEKNVDLLIKAFALLEKDFPDWKLEIWGDGVLAPALKDLVSSLNLQEKIFFGGATQTPEKAYQSAKIFCIPSGSEAFGYVIVEAMGWGVPTVGFANVSGVSELIQHEINGLLAEEMPPQSLAEELSKLMCNQDLYAKIKQNGFSIAKKFNYENIFSQWLQLIETVYARKEHTALQQRGMSLSEENAARRMMLEKIIENDGLNPRMSFLRKIVVSSPFLKCTSFDLI